jgi:hypothetical protein
MAKLDRAGLVHARRSMRLRLRGAGLNQNAGALIRIALPVVRHRGRPVRRSSISRLRV